MIEQSEHLQVCFSLCVYVCVCMFVCVLYSAKFSSSLTFGFFEDEGWSMKFCTTKKWCTVW